MSVEYQTSRDFGRLYDLLKDNPSLEIVVKTRYEDFSPWGFKANIKDEFDSRDAFIKWCDEEGLVDFIDPEGPGVWNANTVVPKRYSVCLIELESEVILVGFQDQGQTAKGHETWSVMIDKPYGNKKQEFTPRNIPVTDVKRWAYIEDILRKPWIRHKGKPHGVTQ